MANKATFDQVVDLMVSKAPTGANNRTRIAQGIRFLVSVSDQLLEQIQTMSPQISAAIAGVEVPAEEATAIRAAYDEYGVSIAKIRKLVGLGSEDDVLRLCYFSKKQDANEDYQTQAQKMYVFGNLAAGFDVLKD